MAGPSLKAFPQPIPIVVDYQRDRHEAAERRKSNGDAADDTSGLFILGVWALSAGLFLTGFYLASEAPRHDETTGRVARASAAGRPLAMTQGRSTRTPAATHPDALAGAHSETRR